MKRILLLLFLLLPLKVSASSAYIKELEIQNGTLSIPFNEKNNIYTIYLEEDATFVDFTYELEETQAKLEIIDKEYQENRENIMILKVKSSDDLEIQTYTFYLEKEEIETVSLDDDSLTTLNITKTERSPYLAPTVIFCCTSLILFLFYLLVIRYIKKIKKQKKKISYMK